jgi:hypothetical protein
VQPVPTLTVDGAERVDVAVGEPVTFVGRADVPPRAGVVVEAEFDFDGSGEFRERHRPRPGGDGPLTSVSFTTTPAFDEPGTYFPRCESPHIDRAIGTRCTAASRTSPAFGSSSASGS